MTDNTAELAKPDAADAVQVEAWYMDSDEADQRQPHSFTARTNPAKSSSLPPDMPASTRQTPNKPATGADLRQLGVLSWKLDADAHETDPRFAAVKKVRGYSYSDMISVSKESLPDYENKLKIFYTEHIHSDEEIRYVIEGSGYFDVRDGLDRWVRIAVKKGDMIVLPEGIYHRFTLDESNYAKVIRLFVGEPVWACINRPCDEHASRVKYLSEVLVGA